MEDLGEVEDHEEEAELYSSRGELWESPVLEKGFG